MYKLAAPLCQESKATEGALNNVQSPRGRFDVLRMMLTMAHSFRGFSFRCPGSYTIRWQGKERKGGAFCGHSQNKGNATAPSCGKPPATA